MQHLFVNEHGFPGILYLQRLQRLSQDVTLSRALFWLYFLLIMLPLSFCLMEDPPRLTSPSVIVAILAFLGVVAWYEGAYLQYQSFKKECEDWDAS